MTSLAKASQALEAGRPDLAVRAAVECVRQTPGDMAPYLILAQALRMEGRLTLAIEAAERGLSLAPMRIEPPIILAELLAQADRLSLATEILRQAVIRQPDSVELLLCLGNNWQARNLPGQAVPCFARAALLRPEMAEIHYNLGNAHLEAGELAPAEAAFQAALAANPSFAPAYHNLAGLHGDAGRLEEAEAAYRRAIELAPNQPVSHLDLGVLLARMGCVEEARTAQEVALRRFPDDAGMHANYGITLLTMGDFARGFAEYEWRWSAPDMRAFAQLFPQPRWRGEPLEGRTILLVGEQGHGDTVQFVRYAPLVAARGGRVILAVQPALKRLLSGMAGIEAVVGLDEPVPATDFQCPMVSLPAAFDTTPDTIPPPVPYAPLEIPKAVEGQQRGTGGIRVGLVWAGDSRRHDHSAHSIDQRRSLPLVAFAPLAAIAGVTFFSLQKGTPAEQSRDPPPGMTVIDIMDQMTDFADTAALIATLDLVISVDTSVAHLAGTVGTPVWLLSRLDGCWRWLRDRDDSPWYPGLRLFRQRRSGDWDEVMGRVAEALRHWVEDAA